MIWSYLRHNIIIPFLYLLVPGCLAAGLHDIIAFYHPFGLPFFLSWVPVLPNLIGSYALVGIGIALHMGNDLLRRQLDPEGTEIRRLAEEELPEYKSAYEEKEKELSQVKIELNRAIASQNHYKHDFEVEKGVNQNLTDKFTTVRFELEQFRRKFNESQELLKENREMLAESQRRQAKAEELYLSAEARKNAEIEKLLEKIVRPINADLELARTRIGPKKSPTAPANPGTGPGSAGNPQSGAVTSKNTQAGNSVNTATPSNSTTSAKPKAPEIPAVGPAPSPSQRR